MEAPLIKEPIIQSPKNNDDEPMAIDVPKTGG